MSIDRRHSKAKIEAMILDILETGSPAVQLKVLERLIVALAMGMSQAGALRKFLQKMSALPLDGTSPALTALHLKIEAALSEAQDDKALATAVMATFGDHAAFMAVHGKPQ